MKIDFHDIDTAPQAAKSDLEAVKAMFGTLPNLFRGFAASPATVKAYMALASILKEHGALTSVEQQVVYLSISAQNECTYCVAAHSMAAGMAKMDKKILSQLRARQELSDPKLNALRRVSLAILDNKGFVPKSELAAFAAAGYGQTHYLEILTILAQKILSNYFNHVAETPLDEMFSDNAWQPA